MNAERLPTDATPEKWLAEHGDLLYKFARLRVSDGHLAEDLVQETILKALANYSNFRHEASIRTWLFQILRNEISNHFRKTKKARELSESTSNEPPVPLDQLLSPQLASPEFATAVQRDEFWAAAHRCFEQLPEHLLEIFMLRLANPDETIEELCKQLDLTPSNFSVRMFRSRLILRQCLEKSWLNEK